MEPGLPVRIWIDDRHPIFRRGMRSILTSEGYSIVGESAAFRPEPTSAGPDVLIFEADAWGLQNALKLVDPGATRLVAIFDRTDERLLTDAIEAGVSAILMRGEVEAAGLISSLRAVADGHTAMPPNVLPRLLERAAQGSNGGSRGLSDRELSVLQLLSEGEDTNEIASQLCYSTRTVKNIVHDVLMKMNCRNRAHAVAQATRQGLI